MVGLDIETIKNNKDLSLDQKLYKIYEEIETDEPFYKVRAYLLSKMDINNEYEYYTQNVNPNLVKYIEENIFPKYEKNDKAHGIIHIREVIRRSFALNSTFKFGLDENMIYAIAACHDINKYIDSDIHEKLAAEAFIADENMSHFFSSEDIKIISEAIADHRSSKKDEPRSIYGKLISSADRNTSIEMVFIRSFFVAMGNSKNNRREDIVEDYLDYTIARLSKRYSKEDPENMFFEDDTYKIFLEDMRNLLEKPEQFKKHYCEVNNITDKTKLVKEYENVNN